jgi:hypothetical protein
MQMKRRDDFPSDVKDAAAKRSGQRCSNPDCRRVTSGPHSDSSKFVIVGVAAHITAAAPGGPRYDPSITPEERASIENCIWLCQNCQKLVDSDPASYPTQKLHCWKRAHEEWVEKQIATIPNALDIDREGALSRPLRLIATGPWELPVVEFSLVNTSDCSLQITSLRAIPCAKMKFETRSIRAASGPRMRLAMDLLSAGTGLPLRLAGQHGVFNLRPGESEAFSLAIECENTINLVCVEAEFVSRNFATAQRTIMDQVICCAAASDMYSGGVTSVSARSATNALVNFGEDEPFWELLPKVPREEIVQLCLRGVAFLCNGDLEVWQQLLHRLEEQDEWGSVLASFSEYANIYPCPHQITRYIDDWLTSASKIVKVSIWDIEIRSTTVLEHRLKQIKEEPCIYLLRVLDATLTMNEPDEIDYDDDSDTWDKFIFRQLRQMSLVHIRSHAAKILAQRYKRGAVEALMAFIATSDQGRAIISDFLETITDAKVKEAWVSPEIDTTKWIDWWKTHEDQFPPAFSLKDLAPRMDRSLKALVDPFPSRAYLDDEALVRRSLALNPATGTAELSHLAEDESVEIRRLVAMRRDLPLKVVELLVKDSSTVVRRNLATNGTIGSSALKNLARDEDEYVRKNAEHELHDLGVD